MTGKSDAKDDQTRLRLPGRAYMLYGYTFLHGLVFFGPVLALFMERTCGLVVLSFLLALESTVVVLFELPSGVIADLCGYQRTLVLCAVARTISVFCALVAFAVVVLESPESLRSGGSEVGSPLLIALLIGYAVFEGLSESLASGTCSAYLLTSLPSPSDEQPAGGERADAVAELRTRSLSYLNVAWPLAASLSGLAAGALVQNDGGKPEDELLTTQYLSLLGLGDGASGVTVWVHRLFEHAYFVLAFLTFVAVLGTLASSLMMPDEREDVKAASTDTPKVHWWVALKEHCSRAYTTMSCAFSGVGDASPVDSEPAGDEKGHKRDPRRTAQALVCLLGVGLMDYAFGETTFALRSVWYVERGIPLSLFGMLTVVSFLCSSLGSLASPYLVSACTWLCGHRAISPRFRSLWSMKLVLAASYTLCAVVTLPSTLVTYQPNSWSKYWVFPLSPALTSFAFGLRRPVFSVLLNDLVPSHLRATICSMQNLANKAGLAVFMATVVPLVQEQVGINGLYRVCSILQYLPVFFTLWFAYKFPRNGLL